MHPLVGVAYYSEYDILVHAIKNIGVFINGKRYCLNKKTNFSFGDLISISPSVNFDKTKFIQKKNLDRLAIIY